MTHYITLILITNTTMHAWHSSQNAVASLTIVIKIIDIIIIITIKIIIIINIIIVLSKKKNCIIQFSSCTVNRQFVNLIIKEKDFKKKTSFFEMVNRFVHPYFKRSTVPEFI